MKCISDAFRTETNSSRHHYQKTQRGLFHEGKTSLANDVIVIEAIAVSIDQLETCHASKRLMH